MTQSRFEVVESKRWVHKITGRAASIYGSVPWTNPEDKPNWEIVSRGFVVKDNERNTVGTGHQPETFEDACKRRDAIAELHGLT